MHSHLFHVSIFRAILALALIHTGCATMSADRFMAPDRTCELVGLWRTAYLFEGSQMDIASDAWVRFEYAGDLATGSFRTRASFRGDVLILENPVADYKGDPFDRLYYRRCGRHEFLVPAPNVASFDTCVLNLKHEKDISDLDMYGLRRIPPLWDGKESVVEYARLANLEPVLTLDVGDGKKLELVLIPAGMFVMGSPETEEGRMNHEGPQHKVAIRNPFYMSKYEMTQSLYEKVTGLNPSRFKGAENPVENISWNDAQAFCKKLGLVTGFTVRLPTEAEWEYACRGGTVTKYYFGDDPKALGDYAWYEGNSDPKPHPVSEKAPNAFGVYDILGNVWEWIEDDWHDSYMGAPTEGQAWTNISRGALGQVVIRGGSCASDPEDFRSAGRFYEHPMRRDEFVGFRVVVSLPKTP